ncbi:Metalloenzyme, LuxS/M16 peptidase-like protein [Nemania serpens]|nr:Metalloenzyme, LuxS/M16 peptidase-like protein [Nemania serpens]
MSPITPRRDEASGVLPTLQQEPHPKPIELVTDQLEIPSLDDWQYLLLVHDPETDKASAALDVNVGNFSDEDTMPGMAHAVEHLLFMGTKKYPEENAYNPSNDEAPSETNLSPLYGGLDRFAQFFIEPLFLPSTLDRELRASDQWRLHQLEKSLSNPKHPYCHFSTGNLEVLKTAPEAQGVDVRQKFIDFYEKHYSANRMKLCVLGRESLDVLEGWAANLFSGIPNKHLPQNRWEGEVPFNKDHLAMQSFAKPVIDSRELNLVFTFLDEENLYESQPSRYISHLIGHEGPGSIMAYIKSKGWANSLSAAAHTHISLLHQTSPQEWIFNELREMAEIEFKFMQKMPASRFTIKISSVMQGPLPTEWLLSGKSLSRDYPGDWDQKEKW